MMRNGKEVILVAVLCVVFTAVSSAQEDRMTAEEKRAMALELLDKFAKTQDKYKSFVIKSETLVKMDNSYSGKSMFYPRHISGRYVTHYVYEIRTDGKHLKTLRKRWGDLYRQKMGVPKSNHRYSSWLWDGKNTYQYGDVNNGEGKGSVFIHQDKLPWGYGRDYLYRADLSRVYHGGSLMGYLYGDDERVDKVLQAAHKISIRDEIEQTGVLQCYVIEAETERGRYKIWIDPEHGYNIAKAMVYRRENDRCFETTIEKGRTERFLLENVRFKKIDGVWVHVEADVKLNTDFTYGDFGRIEKHHKVTEIIFNPDHDARGSFLTDDIKNGTVVRIIGHERITYTWQDGNVVDADGKVVMSCYKKTNNGRK